MHIPDGFLDPKTWAGSAALSGGAIAYAVRRAGRELDERQLPVLAAASAFVFAAQMINFPIAGGTSGHLLGAALLSILFGPWAASVCMTTVLVIQAILFGDGGILVLGANVLNMAVIGTFSAYLTYRVLTRRIPRFHPAAAVVSGWVSVVMASVSASLELALAGTVPLRVVLPAMLSWHLLIGLGEGIITAAALAYAVRLRPGLLAAARGETA